MGKTLSEEEYKILEAEEKEKVRIRRAKIQERRANMTMPERLEEFKSKFNETIDQLQDAIAAKDDYNHEPHLDAQIASTLQSAASHMEDALLHFGTALFAYQFKKNLKIRGERCLNPLDYEIPPSEFEGVVVIHKKTGEEYIFHDANSRAKFLAMGENSPYEIICPTAADLAGTTTTADEPITEG